MRDGPLIALDVGVNLGVAIGPPGVTPRSFAVRLKKPSESGDVAGANLVAFLTDTFGQERPALVFKEAPLTLGAFVEIGDGGATVRMSYAFHGIIEAVALRCQVPWAEKAVASIRKHFIGRANLGDRAETKRAVLKRCILLGYLPKDAKDDNQADALAAWDYAMAHHMRRPPAELHFFNEGATA